MLTTLIVIGALSLGIPAGLLVGMASRVRLLGVTLIIIVVSLSAVLAVRGTLTGGEPMQLFHRVMFGAVAVTSLAKYLIDRINLNRGIARRTSVVCDCSECS